MFWGEVIIAVKFKGFCRGIDFLTFLSLSITIEMSAIHERYKVHPLDKIYSNNCEIPSVSRNSCAENKLFFTSSNSQLYTCGLKVSSNSMFINVVKHKHVIRLKTNHKITLWFELWWLKETMIQKFWKTLL